MATGTPSKTEDSGTPAAETPKVPPFGRAVAWIGLAAGTAITVLAVTHGIRVPGLQVVLSVLVTWVLLMVLAVTVAELARRHHRAAARHAWRHSKRGARFARHHTRRGAGAAGGYLTAKAAGRWQRRQHHPASAPEPLPFYVTAPAGAGTPPSERTPAMTDTKVTDDSTPAPRPGKARTRRPGGGPYSAAWSQVVADTSEFEPEDDGHLLAWMAAEVSGMSAYAEAMTEVYETCVATVGLDPVAMKATHDVADAAADAASAMAGARAKFASHYSEVREFAANGGLLPFDGRWITGDGDA